MRRASDSRPGVFKAALQAVVGAGDTAALQSAVVAGDLSAAVKLLQVFVCFVRADTTLSKAAISTLSSETCRSPGHSSARPSCGSSSPSKYPSTS